MEYEALMFDLDGTLVDTSAIETWREKRLWHECISHFHLTRVNPHVHLLLQSIQNKKIGIVTNAPYIYAEPLLKHHGIRYDALISYEKNRQNKPYPDPLFRCAQHMNVHIEHCIYVGNEPTDIAAAKAAGCISVEMIDAMDDIYPLLVRLFPIKKIKDNKVDEFARYLIINYHFEVHIIHRDHVRICYEIRSRDRLVWVNIESKNKNSCTYARGDFDFFDEVYHIYIDFERRIRRIH